MASLAQSMQNYTGNENAPLAEYYQLEEKYRNITEPIELQNLPVKHRQMVTYFLRDHELISDWSSDVYFGTIPSSPEKTTPSLLLYYTTSDRNTIANLKEIEKSDETILFDFQEGFYEEENYVESKLRWSQENSSLKLYNYTGKKIEVSFVCTSATEKGGKLLIETSNGEKMIDVDISPKKQEIVFEVDPNEEITKLFFTFYGESTVPDETDGRIRAFSIQNWEGEVIE